MCQRTTYRQPVSQMDTVRHVQAHQDTGINHYLFIYHYCFMIIIITDAIRSNIYYLTTLNITITTVVQCTSWWRKQIVYLFRTIYDSVYKQFDGQIWFRP